MATADVAAANRKFKVRCVVGDGKRAFWSEVFDHNPKIARVVKTGERFAWVPNYPTHRPYIKQVTPERFIYQEDFKVTPGEIYLTKAERRPESDYILIEPNTKDTFTGPNKRWAWERWLEVTKLPYRFAYAAGG